jgi:hypothetical protein
MTVNRKHLPKPKPCATCKNNVRTSHFLGDIDFRCLKNIIEGVYSLYDGDPRPDDCPEYELGEVKNAL